MTKVKLISTTNKYDFMDNLPTIRFAKSYYFSSKLFISLILKSTKYIYINL